MVLKVLGQRQVTFLLAPLFACLMLTALILGRNKEFTLRLLRLGGLRLLRRGSWRLFLCLSRLLLLGNGVVLWRQRLLALLDALREVDQLEVVGAVLPTIHLE